VLFINKKSHMDFRLTSYFALFSTGIKIDDLEWHWTA